MTYAISAKKIDLEDLLFDYGYSLYANCNALTDRLADPNEQIVGYYRDEIDMLNLIEKLIATPEFKLRKLE